MKYYQKLKNMGDEDLSIINSNHTILKNKLTILEQTESKTKLPKINNLYIIDERFFGKTKITFLKGK